MPSPIELEVAQEWNNGIAAHGVGSVKEHERGRLKCRWKIYLWAICAPLSLVSSKYLLVDLNFHYPMRLLLLHVIVATLTASWVGFVGSRDQSRIAWTQSCWRLEVLRIGLAILSLVCGIQAILHFPNLATLAMLSAVAFLSHLASLPLVTCTRPSSREALRLAPLASCCLAILYAEYRLTANGLLFGIPAAICAGVTKSINTNGNVQTSADKLFCTCALVTTTGCIWLFDEWTLSAIGAFNASLALLLVANIVASATVIFLGGSWLLNLNALSSSSILDQTTLPATEEIVSLVFSSGLAGYHGVAGLRRSYTSLLQFAAFLAAILILDNGRCFGLISVPCSIFQRPGKPLAARQDSEAGDEQDDTEHRHHSLGSQNCMQRLPLSSMIITIVTATLWVAFIKTDFYTPSMAGLSETPQPSLDLTYKPPTKSEIVISAYREPLTEIEFLIDSLRAIPSLSSSTIHIYVKDERADLNTIQISTGADNATYLPNVGREGETYLHHIIASWDTLAEHTVFVQGDVHNPREFLPRVRDYFNPAKTGMLSLGFVGNVCDCDTCGDRWGWTDSFVSKFYQELYPDRLCSKILLSYKGQFIASARRIRGIDKAVYEELHDALVNKESWVHSAEYLNGRKDSLNTPFFGYTLERLWSTIFQCSDLSVAWRCPTLLGGKRAGGDQGDCQCFDFE